MKKKGHAAGIAFAALVTVGLIAAGVGTQSWAVAKFTRPRPVDNATCIVTRTIGLFSLTDTNNDICSPPDEVKTYEVYCDDLIIFNHGLQYAVLAFCALSMLCCLIIMAVAGFNICENPYQTYCTAFGLAVYNVVGLVCSLLAVILYVVLLYTDLRKPIKKEVPPDTDDTCAKPGGPGTGLSNVFIDEGYEVLSEGYFGYSFFLVMCSIFIYCIGIGLSIHAQKTRKKKYGEGKTNEIANPAHDVAIMF